MWTATWSKTQSAYTNFWETKGRLGATSICLGAGRCFCNWAKQSIADLEPIIDVIVVVICLFLFSVCLFFYYYYSVMCSDFLRLLSCCYMENVGIWCASAFKNIPRLVGCIEAVVTELDDAADGLKTVVIVGDDTAQLEKKERKC